MDFTNIKATLESLGYHVSCFDTAAQAAEYLDGQIDGKTVGIGGSVTLQQMELYERLSAHNKVSWHWYPEGKAVDEVRLSALTADVYLSSVNALAATGEIINIDGACNRVAATLHGPGRVIFVVGRNKICANYDAAIQRLKRVVCPANAKRMALDTPCAKLGFCVDCDSRQRICNATVVLEHRLMGYQMDVVLVDEDLGY